MRKTTAIRSTPRLMLRRKAGHQADEMTQVFRFINDPSDPTRYTTIFQSSGLHEVERLKEDAADPANSYGWQGTQREGPGLPQSRAFLFPCPTRRHPSAPADAGPVRAGLPSPSAAPFHGRTTWSMMVSVPSNRSPGSAMATTIWSPA